MLVNFLIYTIFPEPINDMILSYYALSFVSVELIMFFTLAISAIGCLILSISRKDEAESIDWDENTSYTNAFFYYMFFLVKSWKEEGTKSVTGWCLVLALLAVILLSPGIAPGSLLTFFIFFLIFGMIYTLLSARKNKRDYQD